MKALAFLLARDESGEWHVIKAGSPAVVRQEYKAMFDGDHPYTELYYSSHRGDVKRKLYRKKVITFDVDTEDNGSFDDEPYKGEETDTKATKPKRRGRKPKKDQ